jgi:hypothetical protein
LTTNRTRLLFFDNFGKRVSLAGSSFYFFLKLVPGLFKVGDLQTKIVVFTVQFIQSLKQCFLLALDRLSTAKKTNPRISMISAAEGDQL